MFIGEKLHWNRDEDIRIPFVSPHMSRNRFMEIKNFIHLADNDTVIPTDKIYKVSSFISALNVSVRMFSAHDMHAEQHTQNAQLRSDHIRFSTLYTHSTSSHAITFLVNYETVWRIYNAYINTNSIHVSENELK
jgi:Transposase IS4